ncbi:GNAT family N-acetyltransferase [Sphingomonas psychrotolerans]|uniref:GNAT family N-acetyltransferase n=1 Tax=Sphingomonas psychrotolerans TaxID=1327635 RepID=A0A2K8MFV6_9SPHN|nr:GNAT family N-acetyltransferase [Sphingomonas psychrotolerans]ATY31426.1 GNAT family N-acetyltransferase [Sphingomonas psychrotolerans]
MPEIVTIRVATQEDLPALHPVIERAYRGETARQGWTHEADLLEGQRTDLETLKAIAADPAQCLLLAERDGAVIGCVNLTDKGDGLAYLGLLCVDPTLQTGGTGKQLLAAAEACAREELSADRIEMTVIDVRPRLIAWYERRGYVQTGERRDFVFPVDPPLFMTVLVKSLA